MSNGILDSAEHKKAMAEFAKALSPFGPTIVEHRAYTSIIIKNPGSLYLKKDRPGHGIDYFVGDAVVVNGPLFNAHGDPVGGYIKDGIQHQPFIDPSFQGGNFADRNGIIGQKKNGSFFLMPYAAWNHKNFPDTEVAWAFQNGPILIEHGVVSSSSYAPGKSIPRTALGFTQSGDLIIVASKVPTNLQELGTYLKKEGAENAIYLDGAGVGYIAHGQTHGPMVDGSTTIHITQKKPSREK